MIDCCQFTVKTRTPFYRPTFYSSAFRCCTPCLFLLTMLSGQQFHAFIYMYSLYSWLQRRPVYPVRPLPSPRQVFPCGHPRGPSHPDHLWRLPVVSSPLNFAAVWFIFVFCFDLKKIYRLHGFVFRGGGTGGACPSGDTWLFDGQTLSWTEALSCPVPR